MHPFSFSRATTLQEAFSASDDPTTALIAGGTEIINWMKEGITSPARLIDIDRLPDLRAVSVSERGLQIGSLARMSDVAAHPAVREHYSAISEALLKSASAQLRNMASIGGNLLQRTRCPYFRAEVDLPCNKRRPESGCSALEGEDRSMAIFGGSNHCIATHPSDLAVALAALDAIVVVESASGQRTIPLIDLHRLPGDSPHLETILNPGDLIVRIDVPATPQARRSRYLKLRERTSYEFALVSVAVALDLDGTQIRAARIALGGVAPKPWRLFAAEQALAGARIDDASALRAAIDQSFSDARPGRQNSFKLELAPRLAVHALQHAGGLI